MQTSARLVVIGSGIAGTATCYHLAKIGWKDIVVLEQGPLYNTGGSTCHAPGGMFQTNPSKFLTECAHYTVNLFEQLEVNDRKGGTKSGGIELAQFPRRMEDLKRKAGLAKSWGLDPHIISPKECKDMVPILDETQILGGLYVADDMIGDAAVSAQAMAEDAKRNGVTFHGNVKVTDIIVKNDAITDVCTNQGNIKTNMVLVCAGIWGPKIGDMVGVPLPLQPMQHQYVKTEPCDPLSEISNRGRDEINIPLLRAQDYALYFRQHFDAWGIGNYFHQPLPIDPYDILSNEKSKIMASIREFTPEHFETAHRISQKLFPCIAGKKFTYEINGMFSFSPDGMPLMGEALEVKGFWVCEGVWITHSAGIGKTMAEWLDRGRPQTDAHEADINRFYAHQKTKKFIWFRGRQNYREVYDIVHPMQQIEYPRPLRRSPFYQREVELGAKFFEIAGWERPQWYESNALLLEGNYHHQRKGWESQHWSPVQIAEHHHTRNHAAIYDLSAFAKFEVTGSGALSFLQRICVNQIDVPKHKIVYTSMVNRYGGIECDLTVTRIGENHFWVLTGGGNGPHDHAWMKQNVNPNENTRIAEMASKYCVIGLWGPKAREILSSVSTDDISGDAFPFYTYKELVIGFIPVKALRISFVGELGWEIYCPTEYGLALWDTIWEAGRAHKLIAAGAGAFDSLRIEKGYVNWGSDLLPDTNPYESGLGWTVKTDQKDCVGKSALVEIKNNPRHKRLCCMTLDESNVILGKEPIYHDGKVVGYVTSSNTGYSVKKQIALGYLPTALSKIGTKISIEYFGKLYPAEVVKMGVYDPKNEKLKS